MARLILKLRIRRDREIIKRLATQDLNNNLDIIAEKVIKTSAVLKSKDLNSIDYLEDIFKYIPANRIEVVKFKMDLLKLITF